MRKKVKSNQQTAHLEPSKKSFFNSKWTYLIVFAIILLAAVIYYIPSIQGSSISAHDYQQGRYNAHQLVEYYQETGEHAKWAPNLFSGMPSFQVWISFNTLSSWISKTLLGIMNPYIFIGLLISISSVLLFYVMRVHPLIAMIGGFALIFSNFSIVSLMAGHNNKVMVMSLVPMTLAGIWAVFERKKYLFGLFIISLSMSLQVRLNHVQITYFMMFLVGLWTLFNLVKWVKEKDHRHLSLSISVLVLGMGLGVLNNSTHLKATKDYSEETQRGGASPVELSLKPESATHGDGVGYEYATSWSYGILESFTLIIPNFSGGPEVTTKDKIGENNEIVKALSALGIPYSNSVQLAQSLPTYWGSQPFVAGTTYIGAVLIFLMFLGFFFIQDAKRWWLLGGFMVSLFVAWGDNFSVFYKLLFNYLPYFSKFRTPSMIFYLATIIAAITTALFLNTLLKEAKDREVHWDKFLKVAGGSLAFMLVMTLLGPSIFSFTSDLQDANLKNQLLQMTQNDSSMMNAIYNGLVQERKSMMRADAFRSTILIALTFGLIAAFIKRKLAAELMLGGIAVVMLIDLLGVDLRYVNHDSFQDNVTAGIDAPRATEADQFILQDQDPDFRVLDLTVSSFSESKPTYFHKNIGGYHSVKLKRYQDIISHQINQNLQQLQEGNMGGAHVLNMLNAKYIITSNEASGVLENQAAYGNVWLVSKAKVLDGPVEVFNQLMEEDLSNTVLLEKASQQIASDQDFQVDSSAYIKLVQYDNDELIYEYSSSQPSYAVFSEIYYNSGKGWTAYIDGQAIEQDQVNYVLRGLSLPAGQHEIVFKFDTPTLKLANKIDYASSIIIILLGISLLVMTVIKRNKM